MACASPRDPVNSRSEECFLHQRVLVPRWHEETYMRLSHAAAAFATITALGGTALAQTPAPIAASAQNPATTVANAVTGPTYHEGHWLGSGFVGSNFSTNTLDPNNDSPSISFGGSIGYLWGGVAGVELLGDFAPSYRMNNVFLADNP